MLTAPLSWVIAVLILVLIYTFFRLSYRRPFLRRRIRLQDFSAFYLNISDHQPHHPFADAAGLDPSAIAAIPVGSFASLKVTSGGRVPSDCAVCLSPFEDNETLRFIPNCQHAFHPTCLDPWLAAHATCPFCRANLAATPKHRYDVVIEVGYSTESGGGGGFTLGTPPEQLWAHFWKQKAPLRLKILVCRVLSGAFPISRRRRCAFCGTLGETTEHLFFRCPVARALWYDFWGIRTDGAATGEWTTANWVEAALSPWILGALDLVGEGEMFLFMACLMDKIWTVRNTVVGGEEEEIAVEGVRMAVAESFWELRSAFCISSVVVE